MFYTKKEEGKENLQPLLFKEIDQGSDRAFTNIAMLDLGKMGRAIVHKRTVSQCPAGQGLSNSANQIFASKALSIALFNLPARACENVAVICPGSK